MTCGKTSKVIFYRTGFNHRSMIWTHNGINKKYLHKFKKNTSWKVFWELSPTHQPYILDIYKNWRKNTWNKPNTTTVWVNNRPGETPVGQKGCSLFNQIIVFADDYPQANSSSHWIWWCWIWIVALLQALVFALGRTITITIHVSLVGHLMFSALESLVL